MVTDHLFASYSETVEDSQICTNLTTDITGRHDCHDNYEVNVKVAGPSGRAV